MSAKSVRQYIEIREAGHSASGLTKIWDVWNTYRNESAGEIRWYGPFRKYIFYPAEGTGIDADLMRMVADFIDDHMVARRPPRRDT